MTVTKTRMGVLVLVISYLFATFAFGALDALARLDMATQAALAWLLSASLASWTVRRGFWIPTAFSWLALWALAIAALYAIAAPIGQASVEGIIRYNAPGLAASAVTAMLGASVGWWRRPTVATQRVAT